jgi:hypothetical protein
MPLINYSQPSRLLHKIYLQNYFVSKTSFDMEQTIFEKKIKEQLLKEIVFVTGLARAGTTALFNALYHTNGFASLTYSNMPFLLMPNLGRRFFDPIPSLPVERAHLDGIMVNNKSPEAFDEYFWKVFLNDRYILQDRLLTHSIEDNTAEMYKKYIRSVVCSYGKGSYLSKNNNNVLRIASLLEALPEAKFIVMFRAPLNHAYSLLRQHIHFSAMQKQDEFVAEYFDFLGHHEFGLNQKPFYFGAEDRLEGNTMEINYWLKNWRNYYRFLLSNYSERFLLIAFEDLCERPATITSYLNSKIALENPLSITEKFFPKMPEEIEFDIDLHKDCLKIYAELKSKIVYEQEN